jgi:hypothetical protein
VTSGSESCYATPRRDREPLDYFTLFHEAFLEAEARSGGSLTRTYVIAGRALQFRFAGPALVPYIEPALVHRLTSLPLPPDYTVCLWDSASTHVELPPVPWTTRDLVARGQVRGYNEGQIRAAFQEEAQALSMVDTEQSLAIYWVPAADRIPSYETAAPVRIVLHWCIQSPAVQLVHAGAVGTPEGGVLLAGKGGAGKSTTSLACMQHGLAYAGDDYVALAMEPVPFVWSVYNSAKLNPDSMQRLPRFASSVSNPGRDNAGKSVLFLHDQYRHTLATGFPVRAIVLPQVTELPETRLVPVSRATSLVTLAPDSIFHLPDAGGQAFRTVATVVKNVPSYVLQIGKSSATVPQLISDLLRRC